VKPELTFIKANPDELWWCNIHQRRATHVAVKPGFAIDGKHWCDPELGGITMACSCVDLTGIAEIVDLEP